MERMSLQAQRTLRGNPSSGEHVSRQRLPSSIVSDHRPYSYGDDLRYVDWNVYARQEQVVVKLGEAEQDINIHLLLDASRSMTIGDPPRLRQAQEIVAALGYLALAHSDRLRIVPFGPTALPAYGPVQGKANLVAMLRFVAAIAPQPQTSLAPVLRRYVRTHPQGGILVLCSDLLTTDDLSEALRECRPPRWQVLVLHLLDRHDLEPDLAGPIELEDSETGERIGLTLDDDTLARYRRDAAAWRERVERQCTIHGARYTPLLNDWPLERKIIPYLRTRQLLT
jgi:uncharacterized protein (DUF58 family)